MCDMMVASKKGSLRFSRGAGGFALCGANQLVCQLGALFGVRVGSTGVRCSGFGSFLGLSTSENPNPESRIPNPACRTNWCFSQQIHRGPHSAKPPAPREKLKEPIFIRPPFSLLVLYANKLTHIAIFFGAHTNTPTH